ncbi:hypothetical protein OG871_29750 [Kitasatospora sp. NBC_00374]|uniref:hypothetical protein n=1 Tax=Kitasatospora sp. NBC_00374 TaxID=2975964 RepID=UPI0032439C34
MLKSFWRPVVCLVAAVGLLTAGLTPAMADDPSGEVNPCTVRDICVVVTEPGSTPGPGPTGGGSGGGGGGVQTCSWNGQQWPCWDDDLGWFSSSDGCYYRRSQPQPPAGDPSWAGHDPADGAVYEVNCRGVGGQLSTKPLTFFPQAPGGAPPETPAQLGARAFAKIHFDAPELHAAPAGTAVVGLPVWLWYTPTATTRGPQSATAKGPTLTATATATLKEVRWDTDDGAATTVCKDPGTPYQAGGDPNLQPSCGHVYTTGSARKSDHSYALTATLVWRVEITRSDTGGRINAFDYERPTDVPLPLRVGEVQVLN